MPETVPCEKCGFAVVMQDYTFQGQPKQKKVNPDGSNHNFKLGEKWVCVTSKAHIEWTKTHNGPSGFVEPQRGQQPSTPPSPAVETPKVELNENDKALVKLYKEKIKGVMLLQMAVREVLIESGDANPNPEKVGLFMKLVAELG